MEKIVRLNTKPSKPDTRDFIYKPTNVSIPTMVDLREYDSKIENQGNLGSCTAVAITTAYEVMVNIRYPEYFTDLSSLFVYYHSRLFSDEIDQDAGSYIRDGLKSVKNYGACSEDLWPYMTESFDKQPFPKCYLDASKRKISEYNILYANYEIKEILAGKRPVVACIEIFYDFLQVGKENPYVSMPGPFTYSIGNHAVVIMGYDDINKNFLIKNSYGKEWGDNGYAWLPYDYVTMYSCERWCFDINHQSTTVTKYPLSSPRDSRYLTAV